MEKRVLKFRAWRKDILLMFLSSDDIRHLGSWFDSHLPGSLSDEDNIVIMQFTGLTDKKGVDIYEGDIIPMHVGVQSYANWNVGDPNAKINGFVEWNQIQMCYQISFNKNKYNIISSNFGWSSSPELEVIGNIHQNPELL